MKRNKLIMPTFIVVVIILFSGCNKLKDALEVNFTTNGTEITFTVNPSAAGDYSITKEISQSDVNQEIKDNGGDVGKLKSVKLDNCIFEVVTP
jgi:hypothetical protein